MPTQLDWAQLCQAVNSGTAASVAGPVPVGSQISITAASAWNPEGASDAAVVDVFIVGPSGSASDATHVDRVSVSPGTSESLTKAINQKLTANMSIWAITNGATLTISGAIASTPTIT